MKNYVSALDSIIFLNKVVNVIVLSGDNINELKLNNDNYNFEMIWKDIFEVHFWDLPTPQEEAAKDVIEQLIRSLCMANYQSLVIEEGLAFNCEFDHKQFEFDF